MHQGNQLKFIKFDKGDLSQMDFLQKNVRDFYSTDIATWQYHNGDYSTGLFFTQNNDRYIASQGMIPIYLSIKGKKTLTAKSESSFLLPEFRGKGIFEDLYFHTIETSKKDGIKLIWGFTALSNVWRNKLKFDVDDGIIHESELQIRFLKSISSTWRSNQSYITKAKLSLKAILALTKGRRIPKATNEYTAELLDIKNGSHLEAILELYKKWEINYPTFISIHLNHEYLTWRISNNPMINYKIIGIHKNQQLVGLGIVNDTSNKAYLVDFIVPKKEYLPHCFNELLRFSKRFHSISHLIYWASYKNEYTHQIHALCESFGAFRYVNNSMNFVIKNTEETATNTIDFAEFCINGLWTEGFRI
jgi:hypothetical protein